MAITSYTHPTAKAFRERGGSLSKKLVEEFSEIEDYGVYVSSGALSAGARFKYAFTFQNPFTDHRILVERIVLDIVTAGGTANSMMHIGAATCQGISTTATNSEGAASQVNFSDGLPLNYATMYDSGMAQFKRSATILNAKGGTLDWINGRIVDAAAASLAGTYYIFYRKI